RALLNHADIEAAVVLVLAPRARQLPADDETEDASEPPPPRDETSTTDNNPPPDQSNAEPLAPLEQLIAATRAALPAQLLASLAQGLSATSGTAGGRAGGKSKPARHGRAYGARKSVPRRGDRLHLIETLRAAVPWQTIRRREAGGRGARANGHQDHRRLHVRRDDLRIYRRKDLSETLAVFVVDASGSSAVARLAEAKGAVELLLSQSYARRDHVALVAVRGRKAQMLLPPTRSLTRAKRLLANLPGGGGTPLADGLEQGLRLGLEAERKGQSPMMIVLTDGQANIDRDGAPGRPNASAHATAAARLIRAKGLPAMVIDTSQRPQPRARDLATEMAASYLPLPRADGTALAGAVRELG
ncbi:MAG: VWA domain-containing protein, partial [Pseudomonadota bacterium]